jgi:putative ABC transport system permease protein
MVIGTASVILVVTIGMTGKQYILELIQKFGTNSVELEYSGGGATAPSASATTTTSPAKTKRPSTAQLPGVMYSSPVMEMHDRISFGGGVVKDTLVLGVSPQYLQIRNLHRPAGRFLDDTDDSATSSAPWSPKLFAKERFGSSDAAVGQTFEISGIPFTIIGVFKRASRLRPVGDRRPDHPHSLFRGPLLHRNRKCEADLLLHAQHGRGARRRQGDRAHRQARHRTNSVYKTQNAQRTARPSPQRSPMRSPRCWCWWPPSPWPSAASAS